MVLSAITEKLKRRSKYDFKGRHFKASLILQAVSWYLRYPLSYRDIEKLFREACRKVFPTSCGSCGRRRYDLTFGYCLGFQTIEFLR